MKGKEVWPAWIIGILGILGIGIVDAWAKSNNLFQERTSVNVAHFTFKKVDFTEQEYDKEIRPALEYVLGEFLNSWKEYHSSFEKAAFVHQKYAALQKQASGDPVATLIPIQHALYALSAWATSNNGIGYNLDASKLLNMGLSIEASLTTSKLLDELINTNLLLIHLLQSDPGEAQGKNQAHKMAALLKDLELKSEQLLFSLLPATVRSDYLYVWSNFFREIEQHILLNENQHLLKKKLEDFNLFWNLFYRRFAKEKLLTPDRTFAYFARIDERWNYIIKVIIE
ncbi:MAG: hypothetical protein HQK52_04555 [Oligoflexia bacterium]|nr:hypothetical protein [Oligoflexia bacterium]